MRSPSPNFSPASMDFVSFELSFLFATRRLERRLSISSRRWRKDLLAGVEVGCKSQHDCFPPHPRHRRDVVVVVLRAERRLWNLLARFLEVVDKKKEGYAAASDSIQRKTSNDRSAIGGGRACNTCIARQVGGGAAIARSNPSTENRGDAFLCALRLALSKKPTPASCAGMCAALGPNRNLRTHRKKRRCILMCMQARVLKNIGEAKWTVAASAGRKFGTIQKVTSHEYQRHQRPA